MPENEEVKVKNSSEELLKRVLESTKQWTAIIKMLSYKLNKVDLKDVCDIQAEAISYRQDAIEEINNYSIKILKLVQKTKVLTKERFEYYATGYQVKTSAAEKIKLIDADLSQHELFISQLDEHVVFLRETSSQLKDVNYSIKNRIEVANILGGYK